MNADLSSMTNLKSLTFNSRLGNENIDDYGLEFFNINEIQKRYPHVKFRWTILIRNHEDIYYEGEFSDDSLMNGKGKFWCEQIDTVYEGEFKNDFIEGKGNLCIGRCRYEGEWWSFLS